MQGRTDIDNFDLEAQEPSAPSGPGKWIALVQSQREKRLDKEGSKKLLDEEPVSEVRRQRLEAEGETVMSKWQRALKRRFNPRGETRANVGYCCTKAGLMCCVAIGIVAVLLVIAIIFAWNNKALFFI